MNPNDLTGILLGVVSALTNAGNRALLSRPLTKTNPRLTNYLTALIGLVFIFALNLISNSTASLLTASLTAIAIFLLAGILNFGVSRLLFFVSIKHIGANQASSLAPTSVLFSFLFAVLFLGENLSFITFIGGFLIIVGAILIQARSGAIKRGGDYKIGVISIIVSNVFFSCATILVKAGLLFYGSYMSAILVSYSAAMIFGFFSYHPARVVPDVRMISKPAKVSIIVSALLIAISQILRFAALGYSSVVVVAPITAMSPVFVMLFTQFLAKDFEVLNLKTVLSISIAVCGAVLVSYSA